MELILIGIGKHLHLIHHLRKRSMSSGSAFNATVSIYPSNMAEKSMYISTMDVTEPDDNGVILQIFVLL